MSPYKYKVIKQKRKFFLKKCQLLDVEKRDYFCNHFKEGVLKQTMDVETGGQRLNEVQDISKISE